MASELGLTIQGVESVRAFQESEHSAKGQRESGADVRSANVTAVMAPLSARLGPHPFCCLRLCSEALANILKSSLGPQGLDKMLVDDIGDVTITNDGATILKQLEARRGGMEAGAERRSGSPGGAPSGEGLGRAGQPPGWGELVTRCTLPTLRLLCLLFLE